MNYEKMKSKKRRNKKKRTSERDFDLLGDYPVAMFELTNELKPMYELKPMSAHCKFPAVFYFPRL